MNIIAITPDFPFSLGGIGEHVYHLYKNMNLNRGDMVFIFVIRFADSNKGARLFPKEINNNVIIVEIKHDLYKEYEKEYRDKAGFGFYYEYEALKTCAYNLDVFESIKRYFDKNHINPDIIHVHDAFAAIAAFTLRSMYHIPIIVTDHSVGNPKYLIDGIRAYMLRNADVRLFVSNSLRKIASQRYLLEEKDEAYVIENGIDRPEEVKKDYDLTGNILYAGRLEKKKGVDVIIKSIACLIKTYGIQTNLQIYGDGTQIDELEELCISQHVENNVEFCGYKEHSDLQRCFLYSDVVVVPSREEAFGIVLLEAMSEACVVIASDIDVFKEIGKNNENLVFFQSESETDLADKLYLVLKNKKKRQCLGEEAKKTAEKYQWKDISKRTLSIYEKTVEKQFRYN